MVGSFLNVCIHRLPRSESIIYPYSHCPLCGHRLSALDLAPILSYLLLWGRCRYCRKQISINYLLVEILTGVFFAGIAYFFSPLQIIFYVAFVMLLVSIFFIDLENQVIPDSLSFTGIFLGLLYNLLQSLFASGGINWAPLLSAFCGLALGYGLLFLIGYLGKIWFKKEAMGEGDFLLGAVLGAFLGWQGVLLSIFLAFLLAGMVLSMFLILRRVKFGQYVPFGPALAGGGIIVLFFGKQIINWYLGLLI